MDTSTIRQLCQSVRAWPRSGAICGIRSRSGEAGGYAQGIVETELIPDYREFRRQLQAEQAGKVKKLLDVTGKIMEIDAAPWTPKFWGMLLKALGLAAIETATDQKEQLSNRYQAYEFMKEIEDIGQRKQARAFGAPMQ